MARRHVRDDEADLWREVVRDVIPLRSPRRISGGVCRPESPLPARSVVESAGIRRVVSPTASSSRRGGRHHDLYVGVRAPGLDNTQWRRLSRGRILVEARLDLHGYRVQDAFEAFCTFMQQARGMNWRCVEVVTGMGSGSRSGMIRRELPSWLQREEIRSVILAVVHPHAGNQGAVRILLKKRSKR